MQINLHEIVIRQVQSKIEITQMVIHRIAYLTDIMKKPKSSDTSKLYAEFFKYFEENIKNGSLVALVAVFNEQPVSYGAIILRTVPGDFHSSTYLEGDILNMYTIPEARRQGISTLLLEKLIAEARILGVTKLALHTTVAGEKLYRSAHFAEPVYPYLELVL